MKHAEIFIRSNMVGLGFLLMFSTHLQAQVNVSISHTGFIFNGKRVLDIEVRYNNESNKDKAIWINDWGVWFVKDSAENISSTPFVSKLVNSIFILGRDFKLKDVMNKAEYTVNHGAIDYGSIKLLKPNEIFSIHIMIENEDVISYINEYGLNASLWTNEADYDKIKELLNPKIAPETFYYQRDILYLMNIRVSSRIEYYHFKFYKEPFLKLGIDSEDISILEQNFRKSEW